MTKRPRTETLLVLACAAAAGMLGVSQFTDIFHLTPPGGEALKAITASDQHGYATLVLAIFALILIVVAIAARGEQLGQVAAVAIGVCGVVALLIFLIGDLVLTVCGAALATLKPGQSAAAEVHGGRTHDGAVSETAAAHLERTRRG